jgi:Fasciclin domain
LTSSKMDLSTFICVFQFYPLRSPNITKADIVARNGIIHVIDKVLGYNALAIQPQTSGDWLVKGIALKDMNKYNDALKALDKA